MRPLRLDLGLLLPVAAAVAFAACNGGGDDDDDTTSPSPTPVQVDSCQVVWATPDPGGESSFDFFLVDAPLAQWTTGTKSYTVNGPLGIFYDGKFDPDLPARNAAVTTSGTFDLVLGNGTVTGASVQWDDTTVQTFYALNQTNGGVGASTGTGGVGSFTGVWSDPDSPTVTPGEGTVVVTYLGTSVTLGLQGSYAVCYDRFPGLTIEERTRASLSRFFHAVRRKGAK